MQSYEEAGVNEGAVEHLRLEGQGRYFLAAALLACFYYTIPVIKTPLGYTTYLRLDDFASLLFALVSFGAIQRRYRLRQTRFLGLMFVLLVLAIPSSIWGRVIGGTTKNMEYGFWQTLHYTKMTLIFGSAMVLPMDWRRLRKLLMLVWVGSVAVGIYGGLQYYNVISIASIAKGFEESGPWDFSKATYMGRAVGPLSNYHACLGGYMVVAVFTAIVLMRTSRALKPLYIASLPFFMLVVLWSESRADFFGIFVGLAAYAVVSRIRPAAVISLVLVGICTYLALTQIPALADRFLPGSGTHGGDYSSGRLDSWVKQIQYLLTHPYYLFTGVGLGNFRFTADQVGLVAGHNNYLHWLVEGGIVGLLGPLVLLWRLGALLRIGDGEPGVGREISRGFLALIAAFLAVALTQELFVPSPAMGSLPAYIVFLFGCVVAFYRTMWLHGTTTEFR